MADCEALPLELDGPGHGGTVRSYVRICPKGHVKAGYACDNCASNGAILCNDCTGDVPALIIRRDVWDALLADVAPPPAVHLITAAVDLACGHDGEDLASSVP